MTPEGIAGLQIPEQQMKDLIDALAAMSGPAPVIELRRADQQKAA